MIPQLHVLRLNSLNTRMHNNRRQIDVGENPFMSCLDCSITLLSHSFMPWMLQRQLGPTSARTKYYYKIL